MVPHHMIYMDLGTCFRNVLSEIGKAHPRTDQLSNLKPSRHTQPHRQGCICLSHSLIQLSINTLRTALENSKVLTRNFFSDQRSNLTHCRRQLLVSASGTSLHSPPTQISLLLHLYKLHTKLSHDAPRQLKSLSIFTSTNSIHLPLSCYLVC